ncbi:MAG: hypothetical protein ACR2OE_02905 [Thermomicrobiales bacterium]
MTILDVLTGLPAVLLRATSGLTVSTIDHDPDHAEVAVSIALMIPMSGSTLTTPRHEVTIDTGDLPAGVGVAGFGRYPDQVRIISLIEPLSDQLAAVEESGIAGHLDVARFDADAPTYPHWHVKTHAGSQAERVAWVESLPAAITGRPWTTGAPEVAVQLGVTRSYVLKLAKRLGVGQQIGRDWRFTDAEIAMLRSREGTR